MSEESSPPARRKAEPRPRNLALGVERLGLLGLKAPWFVFVALLLATIAAIVGLPRMSVDDSLGQLFRSDSPDYRAFQDETNRFPSSEYDVLAIVHGDNLLARDSIAKLRDAVTDLQLADGQRGLVSLFSARDPPTSGGVPPPLFPQDLPEGAAYDKLIAQVRANQIIKGKLLSADGRLALIVVALDPQVANGPGLAKVVQDIRNTLNEDLEGTGLICELSGVPVMQLEIREAVGRDRIVYNAAGFAIGALIAAFFLRRWQFVIVAAGPPIIAIIVSLGALAWLGFKLNLLLNLMSPLVMVISFADSMQLAYALRARLMDGESPAVAARNSLLVVGPACVLTHMTAAISFAALQFSSSITIREFGQAGLVCAFIALAIMLLMFPMSTLALFRGKPVVAGPSSGDRPIGFLRSACSWIAAHMVDRPGRYSLLALVIIAALGVIYGRLTPQYRLSEQVPDSARAVLASAMIDAELTGSNPIDAMIDFPSDRSLYAPETLAVIGETHAALESQPGVANVWSLETLRRWLAQSRGSSDAADLKRYFDALPKFLTERFVAQGAAVVSGRIPDADASLVLERVNSLEAALAPIRARHPSYRIAVTGLLVVAARSNAAMIGRLNQALTGEVLLIAIFIGVAFRSPRAMAASILPALFPVFASGAVLWITNAGLQLTALIALMASFGVGLSATIHFLNRLRLESAHENPMKAVESATVLVGPALILTSMVLSCTLLVTVFSGLPLLRLFGWLSAYAMMAALVADLFILRPIMALLIRWRMP